MKKKFLLTILLVFGTSLAFADTVYLKDGKVVEGKIVSETKLYVIIEQGNFPKKYYRGQIKSIEKSEDKKIISEEIVVPALDIDLYAYEDIDSSKVTQIIELIEVNGTRESMERNFAKVLTKVSPEEHEKLKEMLNISEIVQKLVPVYDRHYSVEELNALIEFYKGPLGQKLVEVAPLLMQEAMVVSVQYFREKAASLQP